MVSLAQGKRVSFSWACHALDSQWWRMRPSQGAPACAACVNPGACIAALVPDRQGGPRRHRAGTIALTATPPRHGGPVLCGETLSGAPAAGKVLLPLSVCTKRSLPGAQHGHWAVSTLATRCMNSVADSNACGLAIGMRSASLACAKPVPAVCRPSLHRIVYPLGFRFEGCQPVLTTGAIPPP